MIPWSVASCSHETSGEEFGMRGNLTCFNRISESLGEIDQFLVVFSLSLSVLTFEEWRGVFHGRLN